MAKVIVSLEDCPESLIKTDRVVIMSFKPNLPKTGPIDTLICLASNRKSVELALMRTAVSDAAPLSNMLANSVEKVLILLDKPYNTYSPAELKAEIILGPQNGPADEEVIMG